ncbi:MAG: amidohydrolase family protein [Planctomycetales bacterium]|nr:amidohydrolase family protein [Planctomycetales bacterium]
MDHALDLLAFNLKLLGKQSKKNILISAGKQSDKERMLPVVKRLMELNVAVYATPGTSKFLTEHGVVNSTIHKIVDHLEPNILSFLKLGQLDLVVNVLTGDYDYDEKSDANLIRSLSIENGIPLLTDADVAIQTLEKICTDHARDRYGYHAGSESWNLRIEFLEMVRRKGGFSNHHAHFDKAYLISLENLKLGQVDMQKKWELYAHLKENYTHADLVERISRGVQKMVDQGVTYCRTMVDADSTVGLLPMRAALEVKRKFAGQIQFEVGVQPLKGVLDPASREAFIGACELGDFIGGLPSRDRPTPEKHLDIIMGVAKDLNKPLDAHVDQENNPHEIETEQLALKTIEHGLQGRVFGVHAISMAAKPAAEQDRIADLLKDAGVGVICCPSAALSMKQLPMAAPLHNSIAPVVKLMERGVDVYLGVDNVHDLFMPLVDGDMWFECRVLMEACRHYDLESVAEIACRRLPWHREAEVAAVPARA